MGKKSGLLVVISAPSGGGKTTVIQQLLNRGDPRFQYSVSATTRPARANEKHGVHYLFITEEEFKKKIRAGEFIEWAIVHGNYYGTPREVVDQGLNAGKIILMDIDVQGGLEIKSKYQDDALLIFVMPPSLKVLEQRLRARRTEREEDIQKRLEVASKEIEKSKYYDVVVVNRELTETVDTIYQIIQNTYQQRIGGVVNDA